MDKVKQAELNEIAEDILTIVHDMPKVNSIYTKLGYLDKINIAIKILEIYESTEKRIAILQLDDSLTEIEHSINLLANIQKYK